MSRPHKARLPEPKGRRGRAISTMPQNHSPCAASSPPPGTPPGCGAGRRPTNPYRSPSGIIRHVIPRKSISLHTCTGDRAASHGRPGLPSISSSVTPFSRSSLIFCPWPSHARTLESMAFGTRHCRYAPPMSHWSRDRSCCWHLQKRVDQSEDAKGGSASIPPCLLQPPERSYRDE